MAVIRFPCPGCQTILKAPSEEYAGKKIKCPKCGTITTVSAPGVGAPSMVPHASAPAPEPATGIRGEEETLLFQPGPAAEMPRERAAPKASASFPEEALEEIQEEPPARKPKVEMEDEDESPVRKRQTKAKDEDEDEDFTVKPPAKKGRGILIPSLVALIVVGYLGYLGYDYTTFEQPPIPPMNKDDAVKVLFGIK